MSRPLSQEELNRLVLATVQIVGGIATLASVYLSVQSTPPGSLPSLGS
jgi:hypothetical protein